MQQGAGPPDRSEVERHWDQICVGLTAIGTAVMAAVFLISGIAEDRTGPIELTDAVKYAGGAVLTGGFALMVVRVHRTIFPGVVAGQDRHSRKERDSRGVIEVLGTMVFGLLLWVIILAFIPQDKPLGSDISKSVRVSESTWERLGDLVGPEGTADEKVTRLLEKAGEPCGKKPGRGFRSHGRRGK